MKDCGDLNFQDDFHACLACMRQGEAGFHFSPGGFLFLLSFSACDLGATEGGGEERAKTLSRNQSTTVKPQKCPKAGFTAETGGRKGCSGVSRASGLLQSPVVSGF